MEIDRVLASHVRTETGAQHLPARVPAARIAPVTTRH